MSDTFDPSAWLEGTRSGLPFPLLKLKEGTYRVRILDAKPVKRGVHFESMANKAVICPGAEQGCPFCARRDKVQLRHYVNVLDRQDSRVKVVRYSSAMADRLADLIAVEGDPRLYDIQITRMGKGISDTTYAVAKTGETGPLTAGPLERFDLETLLKPMPVEEMRTQLHQQVATTDRKIRDFYAGSPEQVAGNQPTVLQDEDIPV